MEDGGLRGERREVRGERIASPMENVQQLIIDN